MIYGKSELLKKLSDIAKKGWSNTHIRDLIDTLWRDPNSLRTAGFYYAGGNESVIDLIPGFDEGEGSGSGDDVYSLTFTIDPEEKKYTFYQRRGLLTYHRKFETELATVPCTEGLHYIYFDFDPVSKEEILYVTSPPYVNVPTFEFLMVHRCMVASVYYDAEKMEAIVFNDQRYGSEWNPQMHKTIRNTLGSLRDFGLAFTDLTADDEGDEDIHAQFGISAGAVWHGDIYKTSAGVARGTGIPIMYFNAGDNPRIIENPGWAVKWGSLLQYQKAGEMTDAQEEYFVLYHIFATNCLYNEFISVPGIAEYEKLADAGLAMLSELEDVKELLPYTDFLHIGTLIFQTSAAFTNAAHSRIVSYSFVVFTEMSVQGNGNPSDKIKLVNDQETPDAGTFYGAHYETAEKGFHGIDPRLMGSGQAIFLHSNDSDVSGYKQALPVSPDDAMATYTVAADSSLGEVLLKAFVTDAGYPGVTVIPAGAWIFDLWLAITGGSASSVVVRVYKQDPSGTEMELFYFEQPVTDNVGSQHIRAVAQNMIEIADDDRLAIKLFHKNNALTSRTMYMFVEGDTLAEYKWSNVRIPLAPEGGGLATVETDMSVTGDGSAGTPVKLVNDEETPGNTKYYGTNASGAKGYHALPDGTAYPVEDMPFDFNDVCLIIDGTTATYHLDRKASYTYNILSAVLICSATATVDVKINTTAITGLASLSVTTALSDTSATAANAVAIGDSITLVMSAIDCDTTWIAGKLRIQRT